MPNVPFLDNLLDMVLTVVYNFVSGLLDLLHVDPFPAMIAGMPVSEGAGRFGAVLSWLFPIADFTAIFNSWLAMMLLAWFVMFVWRMVRWVE